MASVGEPVSSIARVARASRFQDGSRPGPDFVRRDVRAAANFLSHGGADCLAGTGVTCLNAAAGTGFPCTRYSVFGAAPLHEQVNAEVSAYAEDRWSITDRLLLEPGVRLDWDEIVRQAAVSPRLAGTYVLDNTGNTKVSAGIGLVYDATPIYLIARPFAGTRQDCFYSATGSMNANCGASSPAAYLTTTFTADTHALQAPRFLNWSVGLEKKLAGGDLPESGISGKARVAGICLQHGERREHRFRVAEYTGRPL